MGARPVIAQWATLPLFPIGAFVNRMADYRPGRNGSYSDVPSEDEGTVAARNCLRYPIALQSGGLMQTETRQPSDVDHILLTSLGTKAFPTTYTLNGEPATAVLTPLALVQLLGQVTATQTGCRDGYRRSPKTKHGIPSVKGSGTRLVSNPFPLRYPMEAPMMKFVKFSNLWLPKCRKAQNSLLT